MDASLPADLHVKQGATFRCEFFWHEGDVAETPISMAGYKARMQIRRRPGEPGAPILSFTSDPGGGLTIEPAAQTGVLALRIGADQTAVLTRNGYYDVELELLADPTEVESLVDAGRVLVTKQVTV